MRKKGVILVVSGPAGSGKGTVCNILRESGEFALSVSRTTRKPRPGEVNGKDYWFVSREEFQKYLDEDDFLEYNQYCGEFYGTPREFAEQTIAKGYNMILEIDVNGAAQVKEKCDDAVLVMLVPPNFAEQERRLRHRGTETEDKILSRLERAREEFKQLDKYDYIVYNYTGETQRTANQLRAIAEAERCSVKRNADALEKYFGKEK
jgi:guanylate kinase